MAHIEEGYYKYEQERDYIQHANNVYNKNFTLLKSQQDSYELPIDGWYFFPTPEAACEFFGVDIADHDYLTYDPEAEEGPHDDHLHPEEGIDPHGV